MSTEETIKALADIEQEFRELGVYLDDLSQQKNRDAGHLWIAFTDKFQAFKKRVIADYKAALSGTEVKDDEEMKSAIFQSMGYASMCWSETPKGVFDSTLAMAEAEKLWGKVKDFAKAGTERVECYLPCEFSESEIYAGTEAGPLPLKLVTLTVVRESDYEPSKEQSQASVVSHSCTSSNAIEQYRSAIQKALGIQDEEENLCISPVSMLVKVNQILQEALCLSK